MNGKKKWRGTGFIVTDNYSDDGSPTNEGPVKGGGEGHTREWISRMGMEQIMDGDSITAKRATSHKSAADVDITAIFSVLSFALSTSVQSLRSAQMGNLLPADKG